MLNLPVLFAQSGNKSIDSLITKINLYGRKKASSKLFACFDKTVYVNNENVWFTAYLLNYSSLKNEPTILSAMLVNDQSGAIALQQKFPIANGLCFGHTVIPDSIPPGDYTFIIYTNNLTNGIPKDVFNQPITIKTASQADFLASLNLVDSATTPADNKERVTLTAETKTHIPIKEATVTWNVGAPSNQIASGNIKTGPDGKYLFTFSRDQIKPGMNFLNVAVKVKNEVKMLKLLLPLRDERLNIRFYPEGGDLSEGLVSTVGWEAKTAYGLPLKVDAVLYQDNQVIDTIQTDGYGMGRFKLLPKSGGKYELKLIGYDKNINYTFPRVSSKGVVISIRTAIADDSLQLKLACKYPGRYFVMVHNSGQVFYIFPVELTASGRKVLVNLADLPKGLATITILDSLLKPRAERVFFSHYNRRSPLNIATDHEGYSTRQKVRIRLKLPSAKSDSAGGVVTIACVQTSKIEVKKFNDIESYHYLKQELDALPVRETYLGQSDDDKDYLEKVLLIKGWRKYQWQDMLRINVKDSTIDQNQIVLNGAVTESGKALKKAVKIIASTDSATTIITTDTKGYFKLESSNVSTIEGRKVHLMLNYGAGETYEIKIRDPFRLINGDLIKNFIPVNYTLTPVPGMSSDSFAIKGLDHTIGLKEVKITGRQDKLYNLDGPAISAQKNECGDYVCSHNVLNCPNHPNDMGNRPPLIGQRYLDGSTGRVINYKGCATIPKGPSVTAIDGLNYSKEFYGSDYSIYNPPEPEYQSTIYWKHAVFIGSKEKVFEFYTSDITGSFSVIVQGVSSNDLIYEKKELVVKKQ
jgi:hypothetical protein